MNQSKQTIKTRLLGLAAATAFGLGAVTSGQALDLKKGEQVVLIGNSLAERMQHHGWLESYVQGSMAKKELVFRNHGFAGDRFGRVQRQL